MYCGTGIALRRLHIACHNKRARQGVWLPLYGLDIGTLPVGHGPMRERNTGEIKMS